MTELERMKEKVKQAHMASGRLAAYTKVANAIADNPQITITELIELLGVWGKGEIDAIRAEEASEVRH